jgi:hypothetical protein
MSLLSKPLLQMEPLGVSFELKADHSKTATVHSQISLHLLNTKKVHIIC